MPEARRGALTKLLFGYDPLRGVVKAFDLSGKVVDATPYFGGRRIEMTAPQDYRLASMALVTPGLTIPIDPNLHQAWPFIPKGSTLTLERMEFS